MSAPTLRDLAWKPRPRRAAWLWLLACGVPAVGMLAWAQHHVDQRLEMLASRRPIVAPAASMPVAAADPFADLDKAGRERVADELRMLNRDWPALLSAIVPKDRQTRLLSLDVNPASGSLVVAGQAADAAAVSTYAMALDASGALREVRLLRVEGQGNAAVFEVSARWP